MQTVRLEDYAEFIRSNSVEFIQIAASGYSSYFFAAQYYKLWKSRNENSNISLWGNMGPHLATSHIQQFSEVDHHNNEYLSNIFIFEAWGSRNSVQSNLDLMMNHIHKEDEHIPYRAFIIRNEPTSTEKDTYALAVDELFPITKWQKCFSNDWDNQNRTISIGEIIK